LWERNYGYGFELIWLVLELGLVVVVAYQPVFFKISSICYVLIADND